MPRRLSGLIVVDGKDDETFPVRDEQISRTIEVNSILSDGELTNIPIPDVKWGGECRVEIDLRALAVTGGDADGNLDIELVGRFFEGTSETTTDLEQTKTLKFTIARSALTDELMSLENDELGAGDNAKIAIKLQNLPVA
jgi:hypothetical protein